MNFFDTASQPWDETSREVNLQEIQLAKKRIEDIVKPTPVVQSIFYSSKFHAPIWFKLENFNVTGSFKIRGAANALRLCNEEQLKLGVVAASAGNHAQGMAYVSKMLGVKCTIFMPLRTPLNKVTATRSHGAEVILVGDVYDDAFSEAISFSNKHGSRIIHAFSDAEVINGQGTAGLELLDQIPNLASVIVPIGGGGLAGGMSTAIKTLRPDVKIIGVQAKSFPSMRTALNTKLAQAISPLPTIADGIAVKRPSPRTLSIAMKYLDDVLLVSEDEIAAAIMNLMEKDHVLSEGAGAVGVAALSEIFSKYPNIGQDGPVCVVISGGNIDVSLVSKIAGRGLIASGRMMQLRVVAKDQPGQLAEILRLLSSSGANLIEVRHFRTFGSTYYSDVEIELEIETIDFPHQKRILDTVVAASFQARIVS